MTSNITRKIILFIYYVPMEKDTRRLDEGPINLSQNWFQEREKQMEPRTPQKVLSDLRAFVNSKEFWAIQGEYNESPRVSQAEKEAKYTEWNALRIELQWFIVQVRDLQENRLDPNKLKMDLENLEWRIKAYISGVQRLNQGR